MATLPGGVWAVASGLASPDQARTWAASARAAQAWTFRRPACGDRLALGILRSLAREAPWLAVHGRADLACLAPTSAVIASFDGLPAAELRRLCPGRLVGRSVHTVAEVRTAAEQSLDFVLFGPVWETPAKRGLLEARGLEALAAAAASGTPVIAIGGVDRPTRAAACRRAGAAAVAALRAARDPRLLAALVAAWEAAADQDQSTWSSS